MKRLSAVQRKAQVLEIMAGMAARARSRADFTAEKVATACGVSSTLLYRLASDEFRGFRAGLPGERGTDAVTASLRAKLGESRAEIERLQRVERVHADCPSMEDVERVLERNEQLEEDNRSLRAQLEHLRRAPSARARLRPLDDPI